MACHTFVLCPHVRVAHNDRRPGTAPARAIFLTKVSHAGRLAELRPSADAGERVGRDRRRGIRALVYPVQPFSRRSSMCAARTATVVTVPGASGTERRTDVSPTSVLEPLAALNLRDFMACHRMR